MSEERRGELLVYGDFSRLFNLQVHTTLEQGAGLWGKLKDLDRSLLTGFVSYVLSKARFSQRAILTLTGMETTDFKDEDWIENIEILIFAWAEELMEMRKIIGELADTPLLREHLTWSHYYENTETKETIKVIFVSRGSPDWVVAHGENRRWLIAHSIDPSVPNYIVIHPVTYGLVKEKRPKDFQELRSLLAEENVPLLSTDEFAHRFIPQSQKKYVTLENWISIRDRVLEKLHKNWRILISASKMEQLAEVSKLFRDAHAEYEQQHFAHAIMDVGRGCEALLGILYYMEKGKEPEPNMGFNDLLDSVKDMIEGEFGKNVFDDLAFIRDWRNKVAHPNIVLPTATVTLQVMRRSEIFYELFKGVFKPFFLE